jgi:phosphoserine phosphatase
MTRTMHSFDLTPQNSSTRMPHEFSPGLVLQGFKPPLRLHDFKLIAFDMDSTLINIECIDEIADAAGKKAEVSAITEAAMRGEITDFNDSLRRRVALLKGVSVSALEEVLSQRLRLHPGVPELLRAVLAAGLHTLLVSGGFTYFSNQVQGRLGIHEAHANVLEIDANGQLTGAVLGEIVDGEAKKRHLLALCGKLGCSPVQAIAVGDGANDLPMMGAAGLSVAYCAKPKVRERAMVAINTGGLDRLLEVLA